MKTELVRNRSESDNLNIGQRSASCEAFLMVLKRVRYKKLSGSIKSKLGANLAALHHLSAFIRQVSEDRAQNIIKRR